MGEDPSGKELACTEAARRPWNVNPALGLALCVVGSLTSTYVPGLGVGLMTAGIWLLRRPEAARGAWAWAGCILPCLALCVVSWEALGSLCLPWVVCALLLGFALPGRINITTVVGVIALSAALTAACDAVVVAAYGMSLPDYVVQSLDSVREQTEASLQAASPSSSVATSAALEQSFALMAKVWPISYVLQAAIATLLGLLGLAVARRDRYQRVYGAFLRYDVPLWGIVALVCSLILLTVSNTSLAGAEICGSAALCLLICLRVLYFLQGLAAGMALMEQRHFGAFARVAVVFALLLAETCFYATCVLGVIDTWANVRHLPREDAKDAGSRGTGE